MYGMLVQALIGIFNWALPRLFSVAATATVSATVYTPMLDFVQAKISSSFSGLSSEAFGFLQFVGIPNAISIIFAAITMQLGIKAGKSAFAKKGATGA